MDAQMQFEMDGSFLLYLWTRARIGLISDLVSHFLYLECRITNAFLA